MLYLFQLGRDSGNLVLVWATLGHWEHLLP